MPRGESQKLIGPLAWPHKGTCAKVEDRTTPRFPSDSHACVHHETRAPSHTHKHAHTYTNFSKKIYSHQDYFNTNCSWNSTQSACSLHSVISASLWVFLLKFSWFISIVQKDHYIRPFNTVEYCVLNTFPSRHAFPAFYSPLLEPFVLFVSLNIFIYAIFKLWWHQRDW